MIEELIHKIERLEKEVSELKQTAKSQGQAPSNGSEKRWKKRILIPLAVFATLIMVGMAMAADVPHSFGTGGVISATKFNENFTYIANRLWDLSGSSLYYDGGNVGIGTAPEAGGLLHVSSGTSGDAVMILESDTDNVGEDDNPYIEFRQDGGTVSRIGRSGATEGYFTGQIGNSFYMYGTMANVGIQFATGSAPASRMYIDETGNVGIGTTSPERLLHIETTGGSQILITDSDANADERHKFINSHSGNLSFGKFSDALTATRQMIIDNDGNVGIGTTDPIVSLHTYRSTNNSARIESGGGYAYLSFITSSVGPGKLLFGATGNSNQLLTGTDANDLALTLRTGGAIRLSADTSYQASAGINLLENGNVGIGTTSPSYKLHVNGTIGTTNSGQVHSDYVFEADYQLRSLEKLEEFIKTEKHLPGIITDPQKAPEVDILALNGKLLAKIEELTLYTIAQEKKLKTHQQRNDNLEARLVKLEVLLNAGQ